MNAYITTKQVRSWVSILVLAAVVAFGAVGLLSHNASAQQAGELRLTNSGVPVNLVASPGSVATTDITVRNSGAQAETLKAGLMKFGANNENGTPTISDREEGDDYFDWVSLEPGEFTLQPNESKTVRMTIDLPKEAAFGYYYAVTFTRTSDEKPEQGQAVKGSIATLVLLEAQVPGAKRELQVADFSSSMGVYEFLPATFNVKIKNTGNVHAVPHGDLTINQGNSELARVAINAAGSYILPGQTRTFTVEWNDGFPRTVDRTENGKVVLNDQSEPESQFEVDWSNVSKFRLGQYTANLLMVYDNGQRDVPVERATQFMVLPWKLLILVAIIVGLIIWAIVNDIIKIEHFLFRKKGANQASATRSNPKFKAPKGIAKPVTKPAAKKTTRKKATKTSATRKKK